MFRQYFDRRPDDDEDAAMRAVAEELRLLEALAEDHADLTIAPGAENIARALAAWDWLELEGLRPILVNAFGEIFFLKGTAVVMLDALGGAIAPVSDSLAAFSAMLEDPEVQDDLLVAGLVGALRDHGDYLGPDECYDYIEAPVLGGSFELSNIETADFVAKHIAAAEVHRDLAEAPPPSGKP